MKKVSKDKVEKRYNRWSSVYDIFDLGGLNSKKLYALKMLDPQPGDIILDVGCGTGALLPEIAKQVGSSGMVVGIDIAEKMVERAKERIKKSKLRNIYIKKIDGEETDFPEKMFDKVITTFGLTSMVEPEKVLMEIYRILKLYGRLVVLDGTKPKSIFVRPYFYLINLTAKFFGYTNYDQNTISMIRSVNFKIVKIKYWSGGTVFCLVATKV